MSAVNLSTDETRVSYGIGRQLGASCATTRHRVVSLDALLVGLTRFRR